jgi:hypothetical protein
MPAHPLAMALWLSHLLAKSTVAPPCAPEIPRIPALLALMPSLLSPPVESVSGHCLGEGGGWDDEEKEVEKDEEET